MKKIALASLVCAMLALGLAGCPQPQTAGESTGNDGTNTSTN